MSYTHRSKDFVFETEKFIRPFEMEHANDKDIETKATKYSKNLLYQAAKTGNLEKMKMLNERVGVELDEQVFAYAAENGNLENMKWLMEQGCPWDGYTSTEAIINGNIDNLKWLVKNGCPNSKMTMELAAKHGNSLYINWFLKAARGFHRNYKIQGDNR